MTSDEALKFISSNEEWKSHFIECHNSLTSLRFCGCLDTSDRSFDNINRIVTCKKCNKTVKDWYPKLKDGSDLSYSWNENGPVPFSSEVKENIKSVLRKEEERFLSLIEEKEPLLISLKNNLTGETLSWLHQTHGIDPDLVEDILCIKISDEQRNDYKKYYDIHKKTGLAGFTPKVIQIS